MFARREVGQTDFFAEGGEPGSTYTLDPNGFTTAHNAAAAGQTAGSLWLNPAWILDPIVPQEQTQMQIGGGGSGGSALILGTAGNDNLTGGSGSDCIVGGPGNDTLRGNSGQDVCIGGPGVDSFHQSCEVQIQ